LIIFLLNRKNILTWCQVNHIMAQILSWQLTMGSQQLPTASCQQPALDNQLKLR